MTTASLSNFKFRPAGPAKKSDRSASQPAPHRQPPTAATARGNNRRSDTISGVILVWYLNEGDVIRISTGGGGGYGDPRRRSSELVLDDLRQGYVTAERAHAVYGT